LQETTGRPPLLEGRPQAAAAIWDWRGEQVHGPAQPSMSSVRIKAIVQSLVGFTVGSLIFFFWSRTVGSIALGIASVILFSGLVSPRGLYAGIQSLFEATGNVLGRIMTWVVMVPLFYLFFVPFGRIMRRGRRDQLKCFYEPDASSYWEPHKTLTAESREHQY
jgi:hypothetical protein